MISQREAVASNPAAAPGTLSSREMIALVRTLSEGRKLIGCDLSELSPPYDSEGLTAKLAARLFLEVMASRGLGVRR